ncbi:hypothetical protein BU17DRAFT_62046 [Hysterangium stoloniferum]|nr:hypothetical protein BU17DRAFT_62046 [Hysterangium stoloniferum]
MPPLPALRSPLAREKIFEFASSLTRLKLSKCEASRCNVQDRILLKPGRPLVVHISAIRLREIFFRPILTRASYSVLVLDVGIKEELLAKRTPLTASELNGPRVLGYKHLFSADSLPSRNCTVNMHFWPPCRYLSLKRRKNASVVVATTDYHYDISLYYAFRTSSPSSDTTYSSASSSSTIKTPVDDSHDVQLPNNELPTPITDRSETDPLNPHRNLSRSNVGHSSYEEKIASDPVERCRQRLPHDGFCKTRWQCPECVQHHFVFLQSSGHIARRSLKAMLNDYYMAAEEYAQAANAACIPTAKLERAKAEYEWAMKRCSDRTRLLAPHLYDQVQAAQKKISAAERECEMIMQERVERAQSLSDLGRF